VLCALVRYGLTERSSRAARAVITVRDDGAHAGGVVDVSERIGVEQHEFGELACRDGA
jgi:hypothetical protein